MAAYPGAAGLAALQEEVFALCIEENLPRLQQELAAESAEGQWRYLLEARDFLLSDEGQQSRRGPDDEEEAADGAAAGAAAGGALRGGMRRVSHLAGELALNRGASRKEREGNAGEVSPRAKGSPALERLVTTASILSVEERLVPPPASRPTATRTARCSVAIRRCPQSSLR